MCLVILPVAHSCFSLGSDTMLPEQWFQLGPGMVGIQWNGTSFLLPPPKNRNDIRHVGVLELYFPPYLVHFVSESK